MAKMRMFYSRYVLGGLKKVLSKSFGCIYISNLGKYLGVPVLYAKVTRTTYVEIAKKIKAKLNG